MYQYIIAISRALVMSANTLTLMTRLAVKSIITNEDKVDLGFAYRRKWGRSSSRILGIRIEELKTIDVSQTVLYVSNHRTMTDPIVQTGIFDSYIIAKNEVSSIPIIGKGAAMTGIVLVQREEMKSRMNARNKTKDLLKEGKSVLVYAEGTTGVKPNTDPFKIGTFKAAAELNIPVVPIAIEYRDPKDYWNGGSLPSQLIRQVGHPNTYVKMRMGQPIQSTNPQVLLESTQSWIDEQLAQMQQGWSRMFR